MTQENKIVSQHHNTRGIHTTPQPQHDNNTQQPERFFSRELDFNIQWNYSCAADLYILYILYPASVLAADVTTCPASAAASRVPRPPAAALYCSTAGCRPRRRRPVPAAAPLQHCSCRQLCGDPDSENQSWIKDHFSSPALDRTTAAAALGNSSSVQPQPFLSPDI